MGEIPHKLKVNILVNVINTLLQFITLFQIIIELMQEPNFILTSRFESVSIFNHCSYFM